MRQTAVLWSVLVTFTALMATMSAEIVQEHIIQDALSGGDDNEQDGINDGNAPRIRGRRRQPDNDDELLSADDRLLDDEVVASSDDTPIARRKGRRHRVGRKRLASDADDPNSGVLVAVVGGRSSMTCREAQLLRLRAECERYLDHVAGFRIAKLVPSGTGVRGGGEQYKACSLLRKYSTCIDRSISTTKCRRDKYVYARELERRKHNLETYNWECNLDVGREYASVLCDSRGLLNKHMQCGTEFDAAIENLNMELDDDKAEICKSLKAYRSCVGPLVKSEECAANRQLMARIVSMSKAIISEYSACAKRRKRPVPARVMKQNCLMDELEQRQFQCQQDTYRTIQARDIHKNDDVCEEIHVLKDCIDKVAKETNCEQDSDAKQAMDKLLYDSMKRYNVVCFAVPKSHNEFG